MLIVLAMLVLGVVIGRWPGRPAALGPSLDWFVVRVAFPARIITLVPQIQFDAAALVPVGVAWGVMVLVIVAVMLAGRLFGWSRRTTGTLLVVLPFGNTAFLGFPTVEALLGTDALGYALLYDQLGSFLALATVGSLLLGAYGVGATPSVLSVVRRTLTFPPFVAIIAGVALTVVGTPTLVTDIATALGVTLVPLAIVSIGTKLRLPRSVAAIGPLVTGIGIRVVAAPAAVLGVMAVTGASGLEWQASVIEAGMSSGVVASILAADNGLDGELAANLSGLGVPFALAMAVVWMGLL